MAGRKLAADWLNSSETVAVMLALEAARPDCARFVGGCVRNALMGQPVDDIDIATQLKPEETIKALEAADIRAIPTGIEHGTITAVVNHVPFEITSLRRDVETDGRRAVVAFTEDWAEDMMRRDFRLNAIYASADGTLHDPTGHGIEDAATGRVVFIGDADERLREDYLRILRFFRFNAWYGAEIDAGGLAACARQKAGLDQIAAERIWKELKKMLGAPSPGEACNAMQEAGVLDIILPDWMQAGLPMDRDVHAQSYVKSIVDTETSFALVPDAMQRLMALLSFDVAAVTRTADRLKLSNAERDRLSAWVSVVGPFESDRDIRRAQYDFGRQALLDWAITTAQSVDQVLNAPEAGVFPLKGEDLLKAGMQPGPDMGKWLKTMENWWISGDFHASKAELLEELEQRLKAD